VCARMGVSATHAAKPLSHHRSSNPLYKLQRWDDRSSPDICMSIVSSLSRRRPPPNPTASSAAQVSLVIVVQRNVDTRGRMHVRKDIASHSSPSTQKKSTWVRFRKRKFGLRKCEAMKSSHPQMIGRENAGRRGRDGGKDAASQLRMPASIILQTRNSSPAARNERRKRLEDRNRAQREIQNMCSPRPLIKMGAKHRDALVPKAGRDILRGQRPPLAARWVRLDRTAARG